MVGKKGWDLRRASNLGKWPEMIQWPKSKQVIFTSPTLCHVFTFLTLLRMVLLHFLPFCKQWYLSFVYSMKSFNFLLCCCRNKIPWCTKQIQKYVDFNLHSFTLGWYWNFVKLRFWKNQGQLSIQIKWIEEWIMMDDLMKNYAFSWLF